MAFAAELVGVLAVVAPYDVGLLVLPVPGFDEDDVALVDPRAVLHPAGDAAHSGLAVLAFDADVVAAVVLGYDAEQLIAGGHSEVPSPCLFSHTRFYGPTTVKLRGAIDTD